MLSGYEVYNVYQSIKLHFQLDNYNAFKYNFRTTAKESTFNDRKDKYFFEKIANSYNSIDKVKEFFLANFLVGEKWIGTFRKEVYNEWKGRQEGFYHFFESDLIKISIMQFEKEITFQDLFVVKDKQHPILLKYYMENEISLETFMVIGNLLDIFEKWNRKIEDPFLWPKLFQKMEKYKPFFSYNKLKCIKIIKQIFSEGEFH